METGKAAAGFDQRWLAHQPSAAWRLWVACPLWVAYLLLVALSWLQGVGSQPLQVVVAGCGVGWVVHLAGWEEGQLAAPLVVVGTDHMAGPVVEAVVEAGHMVALVLVAAAVAVAAVGTVGCLLAAAAACRVVSGACGWVVRGWGRLVWWVAAVVVVVVRGHLDGMALLVVWTPQVALTAAVVGACLAGWEETLQEVAACMVVTSCLLLEASWLLGSGLQMAGGWQWGAGQLWGAGHMVAAVLLVCCPCWSHA